MVGLVGPIKWSIQAPFIKRPIGKICMITICIINDSYLYHMSDLKLLINGVIWWLHRMFVFGGRHEMNWKKKRSLSKQKKWYWDHLSYMCKLRSGRSLPGVEHKPKRIEEAHSGTRKWHRNLDWISMKQYINERLG